MSTSGPSRAVVIRALAWLMDLPEERFTNGGDSCPQANTETAASADDAEVHREEPMPTWRMMLGKIAVYSVLATDEEDARQKIVAELSPRANRQSILERWRAEGMPVRQARG
jgi:hypothetical protein